MAINFVGTVSIFVADQNRALDFYTKQLGFELRTDAPLYPGATTRWIAVAPKGVKTEVILYLPDENWAHFADTVGKPQPITFDVSNLFKVCEDLRAKGVKFVSEPEAQTWGTFATIQDSEGNHILLVEQPAG